MKTIVVLTLLLIIRCISGDHFRKLTLRCKNDNDCPFHKMCTPLFRRCILKWRKKWRPCTLILKPEAYCIQGFCSCVEGYECKFSRCFPKELQGSGADILWSNPNDKDGGGT